MKNSGFRIGDGKVTVVEANFSVEIVLRMSTSNLAVCSLQVSNAQPGYPYLSASILSSPSGHTSNPSQIPSLSASVIEQLHAGLMNVIHAVPLEQGAPVHFEGLLSSQSSEFST